MSAPNINQWLNWEPGAPTRPANSNRLDVIENGCPVLPTQRNSEFSIYVGNEPSKTTKTLSKVKKEREGPLSDLLITEELRVMNLCGARIIRLGSELKVGLWSDVDGPEIRAAIDTLGMSELQVIHLETAAVDFNYKIRSVPDRLKAEPFADFLQRSQRTLSERLQKKVPA